MIDEDTRWRVSHWDKTVVMEGKRIGKIWFPLSPVKIIQRLNWCQRRIGQLEEENMRLKAQLKQEA